MPNSKTAAKLQIFVLKLITDYKVFIIISSFYF